MQNTKVVKHEIDPRRWAHSKPVKLKDKNNRNTVFYDLEKMWGFRPKMVSITKVRNDHDLVMLSAEIPDEIWNEMQAKAETDLRKQIEESAKGDGTGNPKKKTKKISSGK